MDVPLHRDAPLLKELLALLVCVPLRTNEEAVQRAPSKEEVLGRVTHCATGGAPKKEHMTPFGCSLRVRPHRHLSSGKAVLPCVVIHTSGLGGALGSEIHRWSIRLILARPLDDERPGSEEPRRPVTRRA